MKGQRVGYKRTSNAFQGSNSQLEGVHLDRVFEDHSHTAELEPPGLLAALAYLSAGDTLIVQRFDRLARDSADLRRIVSQLVAKDVAVESIQEKLTLHGADAFTVLEMLSLLRDETETDLVKTFDPTAYPR
jgi:DNA invertase Pin-like site-specific DNA recombinase